MRRATVVTIVLTWLLPPPLLALATAPFRSPLSSSLSGWLHDALHSLLLALVSLGSGLWPINLAIMIILAGILSSAAPSPPDFLAAAPAAGPVTLLALLGELLARTLAGRSVAALVRPLVAPVTAALGLTAFFCVLLLLLIVLLGLAHRTAMRLQRNI